MRPDPWAVAADADRALWDYTPLERVGPLRFGMSVAEAVDAMPACGFTSDMVSELGRFGPFKQVRTRFRATDAPFHRADVVAYYVGPMGLTCLAVDALTGPQVTLEGILLVGSPPRFRTSSPPTWRASAGTSRSHPAATSARRSWASCRARSEPVMCC
ncbi:hypothetical protein GCM10010195_38290 [Kitasatospora griseola]|nr:hypothetical protein GCM10010195_38290 [Kitasatospora griseola]